VEEMLKSPENIFKTEVTLLGEDGDFSSAKSYALLARHFKLATLKRPGRVMVLRDITTEKEIENARETFFHMLTHDMRAPLASIQGYAQMLEKQVGKDPLTESGKYLTAILRSSKRLNGMIEDILNTIKLERGEITLSPAPLDAAALCADLFEVYDPLAARKNITFRTEAPPGLKFTGDQRLLERVMANLLGNAIKFTPAAGKLTLACARDGDGVRFLVEDTGPGIPADRHEEIFEKYTQMEEHKHLGFGLGLAMCKLAVELHKGRIWVESEPGKGSRFYVALPGAQT
jgi:signal transduction histidine kinase